MSLKWAGIFLLLFGPGALAMSLNESFSSRTNYASGTAIWNQALGKVHPTLQVVNFKAGYTPLAVDVGDGSHGAFDLNTYAQFSVGGDISGNKIRFDSTRFPILKVTSFYLAPGWTLEPVGNLPLVIYSLSDVVIEGDIVCQGGNGGNATGTTRGLGGTARCGGKNGGNGGNVGGSGASGTSVDSAVVGGTRGVYAGVNAVAGGGGGSWNTTSLPSAGNGATGSSGAAGWSSADPEFLVLVSGLPAGGAGGGGGAASSLGVAGAGGGAGGGVVIIHAVRNFTLGSAPFSTTGTINVSGGQGGSSNVQGGAGGGGGGGSLQIFAGGLLSFLNNDGAGAALANNGLGGTNSLSQSGGNGGPGRNWIASHADNFSDPSAGFYTPAEQAPINVSPALGVVEFNPASQYVISQPFHFSNSFTEVLSLNTVPTSSDFLLEIAGSNDQFVSDDSGFTTDLTSLVGKSDFRFRVTLTASNLGTPDMVDEVNLEFRANQKQDFNMKAAGCGRVDSNSSKPSGLYFMIGILSWLAALKFKAQVNKSIRR